MAVFAVPRCQHNMSANITSWRWTVSPVDKDALGTSVARFFLHMHCHAIYLMV